MKYSSILLFNFALLNFTIAAQNPSSIENPKTGNAFLDLFNLKCNPLQAMLTDSLFIRTQDFNGEPVTRSISFTYEEKTAGSPSAWVEIRKDGLSQHTRRIASQSLTTDNGRVIETEWVDSTSFQTYKERATIIGIHSERPDSILLDIWDSIAWNPIQKTRFEYDLGQKLNRRTEMSWNAATGEWMNESATNYIYDGNQRVKHRRNERWQDEQWVVNNDYNFEYKTGQSNPRSVTWHSDTSQDTTGQVNGTEKPLTPIDSTATWYNGEGIIDSTIIYFWNVNDAVWYPVSRIVFTTDEQKKAGQGKRSRKNSLGNWVATEETVFTPGEAKYTDEPQEVLTLTFNSSKDEWTDQRSEITAYHLLADGRIYGSIQITEAQDSEMEEVFFAEAWFHLLPPPPESGSVADRSNKFTFYYTCNLANPYIQNQTMVFPDNEASGDYVLSIFTEDGRLVYHQRYDTSGVAMVTAPLPPGFYLVSVKRGNTPLCNQKLIVK